MKYLLFGWLQVFYSYSGVIRRPWGSENHKFVKIQGNDERMKRQSFLGDSNTPVIKFDPKNEVLDLSERKLVYVLFYRKVQLLHNKLNPSSTEEVLLEKSQHLTPR